MVSARARSRLHLHKTTAPGRLPCVAAHGDIRTEHSHKTVDDLFQEGFDAVFLGIGSNKDAKMEIPGKICPVSMKPQIS